MGIGMQPAQEILYSTYVDNVGPIAIDQPGISDQFRNPDPYALGADMFDIACHYFTGDWVAITEQYFVTFA